MIAMHYRIALPADYDMTRIRHRIATLGQRLDGFPGLLHKSYLYAGPDTDAAGGDAVYAPFYLWRDPAGIRDFLCGPGFAQLCRDFGRPVVRLWPVAHARTVHRAPDAAFATLHEADLDTHAADAPPYAAEASPLGSVEAFDPRCWRTIRLCWWAQRPPPAVTGTCHVVGYVATGADFDALAES